MARAGISRPRQHIEPVFHRVEVGDFPGINVRDVDFTDAQSQDAGRDDHFQVEIKGLAEPLKGNGFKARRRLEHVPAVVFGHFQAEAQVFQGGQAVVGRELVKRHAALERAAAQHTGPLHQVGLAPVQRSQQVGIFPGEYCRRRGVNRARPRFPRLAAEALFPAPYPRLTRGR